jgi:hypothetical protein
MSIKFGIKLLLIFCCAVSAFAQNKIVHSCNTKQANQDQHLEVALEKSVAEIPTIKLLAVDEPCVHKKYITDAFKRTFGKTIAKSISGHTFSFLSSDAGFFSIDKFTFEDQAAIQNFEKIVHQKKDNSLQVKSLTYYNYFVNRNELIMLSA